jgi:hypothetical protein
MNWEILKRVIYGKIHGVKGPGADTSTDILPHSHPQGQGEVRLLEPFQYLGERLSGADA